MVPERNVDRDREGVEEGLSILDRADPVQPSRASRSRVLGYARTATGRTAPGVGRRGAITWLLAITAAFSLGALLFGRGAAIGGGPNENVAAIDGAPWTPLQPTVGRPFPDLRATDIATGDVVSIADFRGKVVVVNVWATWCLPCQREMPSMEALYRELGSDDFAIVAVSVDREGTDLVRQWVDQRELTFTVLHDRDGLVERWFPYRGVPESYLLDRQGVLVETVIGPRTWDTPEHSGSVRALLARE